MKSVLFLLISVAMLAASAINAQGRLTKDELGKYSVSYNPAETGITCDVGVDKYENLLTLAMANPDKFIFAHKSKEFVMTGLFTKSVSIQREGIKYESEKKNIAFIKKVDQEQETSFVLIVAILSLILMTISVLIDNDSSYVDLVAMIVAAVLAVASIVANAPGAAIPASLLAVVSTGVPVTIDGKYDIISYAIYYIAMIIYFLSMFGQISLI